MTARSLTKGEKKREKNKRRDDDDASIKTSYEIKYVQ